MSDRTIGCVHGIASTVHPPHLLVQSPALLVLRQCAIAPLVIIDEVIVSSTIELELPFVSATVNLPPLLQQEVEKWASCQGISSEQFILAAVADKVAVLNHQVVEESVNAQGSEAISIRSPQQPKSYRKEGILVVDAELPENFDINAFIDELREERIREQMAL